MSVKIKLPQQNNIISITDDCALLEEISKSGFYVYKFKYFIDPAHWVFSKKGTRPTSVIISIARNKSDASKITLFNDNTDNFADNILKHTSRQKDLTKHLESQNTLWNYRSDFTKNIPNNLLSEIQSQNVLSNNTKLVLSKKTKTSTMLVSDIKNSKQILPKLQVNIAANLLQPLVSIEQRKIQHIKSAFLYKSSIDPAAVFGIKTNSIVSAARSLSGVVLNKKTFGKLNISTKIISRNKNITNLVNNTEKLSLSNKDGRTTAASFSHLNKIKNQSNETKNLIQNVLKSSGLINTKDLTSTADMSDNNSIPVAVTVESNLIEIQEIIHIPTGILGIQDFKLIFELRTPQGVLIQKEEKFVKHEQQVLDKGIPVLAPEIGALNVSKPGKFFLELKQNDEDATHIQIFRRVIPLDEPMTNANYSLIKSVAIEKGQHPKVIEDNYSSINPVIYRAIAANAAGILGGEFASLVINQERSKIAQKRSLLRRPSFVSLTHRITNNQIELSVNNIPPEPIAIQIKKRNLTLFEKSFIPVTNVVLLSNNKESGITVFDSHIKDSNIYEYHVRLIYEDGFEVIANNNIIVEYTKIETNILNIQLTPPAIISTDNSLDVEFHIEKNIIATDKDNIKALLIEQGLLEEYQSDVILNKEKLQDLFFIRIVRTNITSGAEEDFGVVNSKLFIDSKFGKVKNVKALENGMKYRYAIYAHARAPNTLLENIETSVTTRGLTHTYKASKWRNPITLRHGNMVSEQSIKRNHSKTQFTIGNIVDLQYLDLDLSNVKSSIVSSKATNISEKTNLIKWTINGDVNKIDHFIISLDMSGNKTIVGKCHNITNSSNFQFVDIMDNHESGELIYGITPIYYDYSTGNEHSTNAILI